MAYLGNINGPRRSDVIDRLGHTFFGINPGDLQRDVEWEEDGERRGEIIPLHVDETGEAYIDLSTANGTKRYYLKANGHQLHGEIRTYTDDEAKRWAAAEQRRASQGARVQDER